MQRYQRCLTCEKRGETCDGPNLLTLTAAELIEFCRSVRQIKNLSINEIADGANLPRGTVSRVLTAKDTADFRYETIRPIALYLCGCKFLGYPCPTPDGWEEERLRNTIEHQEQRINHLEGELSRTTGLYDGLRSYHRDYVKFMRRIVIALGISTFLLAATLIILLIIDATVPELGFFFRR